MESKRLQFIRKQAIDTLELTKGFTPEQREGFSNELKAAEELAGYVLELTNIEAQPGAVWVKCWERKPDTHKVRFKDRHGNEFIGNYSKDTGQYWAYGFGQAINDVIYWRSQDESPAAFNPELLQVMQDAEKSKEEDLKAVKEVISGAAVKINREWVNNALVEFALAYHRMINKDIANDAAEFLNDKLKEAGVIYVLSEDESAAGREDAVEFLTWIRENEYTYNTHNGGYWYELDGKLQETFLCDTDAELYTIFKHQKEK